MEYKEEQMIEEKIPSHSTRVYFSFVLLVLLVVVIIIVKAQWQEHVPVRQVAVEGNSIVSKDEVIQLMKLSPHVSMYALDLTVLQQNILANSFVKSVVVKRDAPAMLRVEIEERKPAAILVGTELHYIDEEGIVLPYLATAETYDIPVIGGIDSVSVLRVGQKLSNADVQEALEIIRVSKSVNKDLFHSISEIRLRKGHDIVLYSFETGVPIIFGQGDVAKKIVKLDSFWQKVLQNNDKNDIQYIDIRFDDQVVVSHKNS